MLHHMCAHWLMVSAVLPYSMKRPAFHPTEGFLGVQMAHEQLVSSSQGLREQGRACPTELMRSLMLLYSYILVKALVRMGDHQVSPPSPHNTTPSCTTCTDLIAIGLLPN